MRTTTMITTSILNDDGYLNYTYELLILVCNNEFYITIPNGGNHLNSSMIKALITLGRNSTSADGIIKTINDMFNEDKTSN